MKKSSFGCSNKGPKRMSNRGLSRGTGPTESRNSRSSGFNKSHIPVSKLRTSSADRDSRSRVRANDLSASKRPRSRTHVTPSTPSTQHWEGPTGLNSAQSVRSRSSSRCGSAERGFNQFSSKVTDSRPIKDPGFQQRAMVRVYSFFQRQRQGIRDLCPPPNSRSIMIQSFVEMMGFLLQHFFCDHGVYKKNYTEEIPKLMKKLYYPGTVSSSWLKTVNAPHAWPHVIAVLSWLVDLIVEQEKLNVDDFFVSPLQEEICDIDQRLIFKSVLFSFEAWNDHEDGKCEQNDRDLKEHLKEKQGFTDDDLRRLDKENEALLEQLNDPVELHAIKEHEHLVENVKALKLKKEEITLTSEKQNSSLKEMQTQLGDLQRHCVILEQEKDSKLRKGKNLSKAIATQSMSVKESLAIKEECDNLRREIANNDEYLFKIEKLKCADDLKMASIKNKLNKTCVEFNKDILQSEQPELHTLTIKTNLNFHERDFEIAVSEMSKIDDSLKQLKTEIEKKVKTVESSLKKHEDGQKEFLAEREKVHDKMESLQKEHSAFEKELEMLEAELEGMARDFSNEYSAIQAKTKELIKSMPKTDELTAKLNVSLAKETQSQRSLDKTVEEGIEFIHALVGKMEEYHKQVFKELSEAKIRDQDY